MCNSFRLYRESRVNIMTARIYLYLSLQQKSGARSYLSRDPPITDAGEAGKQAVMRDAN